MVDERRGTDLSALRAPCREQEELVAEVADALAGLPVNSSMIPLFQSATPSESVRWPWLFPRPSYQTSPGRQSQLIGAVMSSGGEDGMRSTMR